MTVPAHPQTHAVRPASRHPDFTKEGGKVNLEKSEEQVERNEPTREEQADSGISPSAKQESETSGNEKLEECGVRTARARHTSRPVGACTWRQTHRTKDGRTQKQKRREVNE